jgi:hypothetical protein
MSCVLYPTHHPVTPAAGADPSTLDKSLTKAINTCDVSTVLNIVSTGLVAGDLKARAEQRVDELVAKYMSMKAAMQEADAGRGGGSG